MITRSRLIVAGDVCRSFASLRRPPLRTASRMTHESPKLKPTFGYLSAVYSTEHGYFGGYLIVSPLGRPLEFHCTAPVLPSRAQRILYGPTLEPYLLGEQIGGGLMTAAKLSPRVVLTDFAPFEAVKSQMNAPLVLVHSKPRPAGITTAPSSPEQRSDASGGGEDKLRDEHPGWSHAFLAGDQRLHLAIGMESQRELVIELIALLAERVALTEPFERIHEAIREAQRIGAKAPSRMAKPRKLRCAPLAWSLELVDLSFAAPSVVSSRCRAAVDGVEGEDSRSSFGSPRPIAVRVDLTVQPAGVVSSPLPIWSVRTIGFRFAEQGAGSHPEDTRLGASPRVSGTEQRELPLPAPRHTRIRPPRDLVKLEDRLRFLLAAAIGIAAGRPVAAIRVSAVWLPVRWRRVPVSAA